MDTEAVVEDLRSRREFLAGALGVSGLAITGLLESGVEQVPPPTANAAQAAATPIPLRIGEIASENGKLHAVISIKNANRTMPVDPAAGSASGQVRMLRYFEGKNRAGEVVWPPPSAAEAPPPLPGPTLRAHV